MTDVDVLPSDTSWLSELLQVSINSEEVHPPIEKRGLGATFLSWTSKPLRMCDYPACRCLQFACLCWCALNGKDGFRRRPTPKPRRSGVPRCRSTHNLSIPGQQWPSIQRRPARVNPRVGVSFPSPGYVFFLRETKLPHHPLHITSAEANVI
jgi:hypothetical protein